MEPRRGLALPVALAALVLLAALVAGALFVATEELRAGRTDLAEQRALAAAELGTREAIERWDPSRNVSLAPGSTPVVDTLAIAPGVRVEVIATRVRERAFWLVAHASASGDRSGPAARRSVGSSLRLIGPRFAPLAALTAAGAVVVSGGGQVDGLGATPSAWEAVCDASPVPVAGVLVPDTSRVCDGACGGGEAGRVIGDPPKRADASAAAAAAYDAFGDETRAALSSRAGVVLSAGRYATAPVVDGGRCTVEHPLNWGDPGRLGPCGDHFPLIHVRGDLTLAAGSVGQGVLLVDGDLRLEAGAAFTGVAVALDDIVIDGGSITGAAFVRDADGADATRVDAAGAVRFAGCAVARAALGVARLAPTPVRWWTELR